MINGYFSGSKRSLNCLTRTSNSRHISETVDFENVSKKASYISPVPGGVGPMTIAMLMNNVVKAAKQSK